MSKQRKRQKKAQGSNIPVKLGSPNRPRLAPHERQLSRFYEPLVLLYTLGRTRGEHTHSVPFDEADTARLSHKDLRRKFLNDLAYMCDYDKGGDTVTAIGLESTPQGHIFWVASNKCPKTKIVPFLESLLIRMRQVSAAADISVPDQVEGLAAKCINFATPRIKKYKSHLSPLLRRCVSHLAKPEHVDDAVYGLAEWLRAWEDERSPVDLCRFAYQGRKSDFMRSLARLGTEPSYKTNKDAIHHAFWLARHYIGRLGHHFRAATALLSCAPRLSDLLHNFEVRSIPIPPRSEIPPADGKTRLDSVIVRMLPANSPDLDRYQQKLAEMDAKYQFSYRFLDNYRMPSVKPRVHAEIQVLEHFFVGNLQFADGDPFIACSKPACFCCLLYFRSHPGHFEEPVSHHKIYLNWRPPDLNPQGDTIGENHQRDILNVMTQAVRKEALRQIHEKTPPQSWHPDSLTGITETT
ncbi:hypothetical protein BDV96DRAFT_620140, partial [Lophiotrema nucula]